MIQDYRNLEGALVLPELTSLDVSANHIEECEGFLEFMGQFQQVMCLYFKGNPFMRKISKYRRGLTISLPKLAYLDDRPIWEID